MKKTLLSVALAALSVFSFAQEQTLPDSKDWKKGDDVTDKLGWGNLSFTSSPMDYWAVSIGSGNPSTKDGLFEAWNSTNVDVYQYVRLPKGQYRLECQGYYRCGGDKEDASAYSNGTFVNNANLYVQMAKYDATSKAFKVSGLNFKSPLMPRLYERYGTKLYTMPESESPGWDMSDAFYESLECYGPCSIPGSLIWFQNGLFSPKTDEDGTTYNSVSFFVSKDTYVRVGVTKDGDPVSGDSFMATNFKMYYEGAEVDASMGLMAMQAAVNDAYDKVKALEQDLYSYEGIIYTILYEQYIEPLTISDDLSTIEKCDNEIARIDAIYDEVIEGMRVYGKIKNLVSNVTYFANNTSYPGKEAFMAVLEEGKKLIDPDAECDEEKLSDYTSYYDKLIKARLDYVMSQSNEDKSYDFTFAVSYPWFCDPKYEPYYVEGVLTPNDSVMASDWSRLDDRDGTVAGGKLCKVGNEIKKESEVKPEDVVTEEYDTPAIATQVTIGTDTSVENEWFSETTEGGHLSPYWNDKLTCAKKWDVVHEGYNRTCQRITNLPNGYYKLKAYAQTWNNDWSAEKPCKIHIFIESGESKSTSPYLEKGGWWGNDINQWNELETGIIKVTNNEVLIAGEDNGFVAFTGFRLFYWENPNFRELLKDQIESVETAINATVDNGGLRLLGDRAKVREIYANFPKDLNEENFSEAAAILKEAQTYIDNAKKVSDEFATIRNEIINLSITYDAYNPIEEMASQVGDEEKEGLTYLGELPVKAVYEQMKKYYDYIKTLDDEELLNEQPIKDVHAANEAYFAANYCTVEEIAKRQNDVLLAYNVVKNRETLVENKEWFAKNAKGASLDNPVEISALFENLDFTQNKANWEWENSKEPSVSNEYRNAEFYNTTFDLHRTLYGAPAGCYRIAFQGFYRNGTDYAGIYDNYVMLREIGEPWDGGYAYLYANERSVSVTSFASEDFTEAGMTSRFNGWDGDLPIEKEEDFSTAYPWDTKITKKTTDDKGNVTSSTDLYYPNSMEGGFWTFYKRPNSYINTLEVMVEDGASLTFGVRKAREIGGDWLIFNWFKVYYLGTETPVGINTVNSAASSAIEYYNAAGIRTNGLKSGINIVRKADGSVVKIAK